MEVDIEMKKLLNLIFLMMISTNAMAEWILLNSGDSYDTYADQKSARKTGKIVKMFELMNYKSIQNDTDGAYLSDVIHHQYDCKNETHKLISVTHYSENMQQGKSFGSIDFTKTSIEPSPIIPNTVAEELWKIACRKK
jgi:hypothetical protein